ncbi:RES domain-containing protein [Synechococcus sp. CCY9201]|uniref:RES domain-containing protein n=1 Tax=Synechococcus sp. CCY9201 TaxID=174697 RepID=UPI002B1EE810|nr:RES domain-containing protein [Synechococcus sp. CCY9201]MEA5474659.1 RES domain-containing protein [Synechococcus sp. CCY9201]
MLCVLEAHLQPLAGAVVRITPFRYPPLRSGSRFTAADQRELFYGARGLGTVLAERAFHALRFLEGSPCRPAR